MNSSYNHLENPMASPNQLRVVEELAHGSIEQISPSITDDGAVSYPDVEEMTELDNQSPSGLLEHLAQRDLLERVFQEKVYVCPSCQTEGMSYTTVCPSCKSPHAIKQELFEHRDCNYLGSEEEFKTADDELTCPNCDSPIESSDEVQGRMCYVCRTCGTKSTMAEDALQCRACDYLTPPDKATEEVLYSYQLSRAGERWVASQLQARELATEVFAERGFEIEVDTTLTGRSGTEHSVHVYGEDDVMDNQVIANIHSRVTSDDVASLQSAAEDTDTDAYLITTEGAIDHRAAELAESTDITILTVSNGEFRRSYEIEKEEKDDAGLLQRINSLVGT